MPDRHAETRVSHELVRRTLSVVTTEALTPAMRRLVFQAESLKTFASLGYDDHVKVFFPTPDTSSEPTTVGRDFTPRQFDRDRGLLTMDFALHDAGPATTWARHAKVGDTLQIGGPRGSLVVADDFDWYLMIGDETALPAIGRRLEELRPGVPVTTVVAIADDRERQHITTAATWTPIWLTRDPMAGSDEPAIRRALDAIPFPIGDGYVWLAGESATIRSLRSHLIDERGHPAQWVRAAGYWKRDLAGGHERM